MAWKKQTLERLANRISLFRAENERKKTELEYILKNVRRISYYGMD